MKTKDEFKIRGEMAERRVWIGSEELSPVKSQGVTNHSPDGFSWGYGGSGPAQLALAILMHYVPADKAMAAYQDLKWEIIAGLPAGDWEIPEKQVKDWIKAKLAMEV